MSGFVRIGSISYIIEVVTRLFISDYLRTAGKSTPLPFILNFGEGGSAPDIMYPTGDARFCPTADGSRDFVPG